MRSIITDHFTGVFRVPYQYPLILLMFTALAASAEVTGGLVAAPPVYTGKLMDRMGPEDLLRIHDEFQAMVVELRTFSTRTAKADAPLDLIKRFGRFQFSESQRELTDLLRRELKRADPNNNQGNLDTHPDIFITALETLAEFGSLKPKTLDEELSDLMTEADERLARHPFLITLSAAMRETRAAMTKKFERLPSLTDLVAQYEATPGMRARLHLRRMGEVLSRRIKGQPELVRAALSLERRAQFYGDANRVKPDAMYVAGGPGTGKDTTAEAFADALNGADGAHRTHLYRMPVMVNMGDLWKVMGSSTGFIGSQGLAPLLKFLVHHSGGRYKLVDVLDKDQKPTGELAVHLNKEWIGKTLPGYTSPEKGVVFLNEFHNWSKMMKDTFVKQALEKGYFSLNNPNGGEAEIYVPIRIMIATNEGIELITSREANGARRGRPLTYAESIAKWEAVHENKDAIKNSIMATNGSPNSPADAAAPGISEELLSRIDPRFLLLTRPMSPEALRDIAEIKLRAMADAVANHSNLLGKNEITWTPAVVEMVQAYDYQAEDGTRPLESRLKSMVEEPLVQLIEDDVLKQGQFMTKIKLDVRLNDDRTRSLIAEVHADQKAPVTYDRLIDLTLKDRPRAPLTDDEIDQLAGFEHDLKSVIFGLDDILERMGSRLISLANQATAESDRPASIILADGLSSTGKSQLAKEVARVESRQRGPRLEGVDDDDLVTFDFSQIQTLHDFKVNILGLTDGHGNPIPSKFMKEYDRRNGQITVALDELPNVQDPNLLKALYDFFREPIVSTFSDHKPRRMAGVKIIITGNASEGLYTQVPSDIPMEAQMEAWAEIYRRTAKDSALQRRLLLKVYPEALLNRIGRNNIFLVPPHTYKSLRQVAQLKLGFALDRLRDNTNSRGWDVVFPNSNEYSKFVDVIINEGFALREQAASIDTFIRDDVEVPLDSLLLTKKVPSGSRVVVKKREETPNDDLDVDGHVIYDVFVENRAEPLEFRIKRPFVQKPLEPDENILITTSGHEAGHDLVEQVLFPKAYTPTGLYVIPGVTMINNQWVYYLGLARSQQAAELSVTREYMVRQIASLLAGETAERLITQNENHSAGKASDIGRTALYAQRSIIEFGLSKRWGLNAIAAGQTVDAYIAGLPERQKSILHAETNALLKEGEALAQAVLEANFDTAFVPLTLALAERGRMERTDLEVFYRDRVLVDPTARSPLARIRDRGRTKLRKFRNPRGRTVRVQLDKTFPRPPRVANLPELARARKQAQFDQVALPDRVPVGSNPAYERVTSKTKRTTAPACQGELLRAG